MNAGFIEIFVHVIQASISYHFTVPTVGLWFVYPNCTGPLIVRSKPNRALRLTCRAAYLLSPRCVPSMSDMTTTGTNQAERLPWELLEKIVEQLPAPDILRLKQVRKMGLRLCGILTTSENTCPAISATSPVTLLELSTN